MSKARGILSQSILFSGLPETDINALLSIAIEKPVSTGELIFSEGDSGDGFYVTIEGLIKVYKLSTEGKEQILHMFGPGEPFGEVPVFSGEAFPASAEGIKKSRILFFPRRAFRDLIAQNPSVAMNMLAVLSRRLRNFTVQVENLSLKEVPARLAGYFLLQSEEQNSEDTITLNISKGHLASFLGTIPETLSRMLRKMNEQGLIEVESRKIRILDRQGLEELAEFGKMET
ncbi:MAG: Crp/Fnr family transcriptional regulator [Desulfobacteraceae bacterium]|nr:Crp/Fnr family transcriptional regulator [Desulfobacteraceae bacterium]